MRKEKLVLNYDKKRDVLYILLGKPETINIPWSKDEDICFDADACEVVGFIITNFTKKYPKLAEHLAPKERWFIGDFFAQRLKDWNLMLSPLKSKKALLEFLMKEHSKLSPHLARL